MALEFFSKVPVGWMQWRLLCVTGVIHQLFSEGME